LEKAIYQVEQAIKRSKSNGVSFDPDSDLDLQQLIQQSQTLAQQQRRLHTSLDDTPLPDSSPVYAHKPSIADSVSPAKADEMAVDNADNPLQLLAMASAMPNPSSSTVVTPSPAGVSGPGAGPTSGSSAFEQEDAELQRFFGSLTPVLDNSPDIDPVELGLVTDEEADSLFAL
jgi:hypothetical protein